MTSLAQQFDADALVRAIRQDPVPAHAAAAAAAALAEALRRYQPPSLEAHRLAEEAAGAVQDALSVLTACELPPPSPPRSPPQPRALPTQVAPPAPPPVDLLALAPVALSLVALPLQRWPMGGLLVLGTATAAALLIWRSQHSVAPPPPTPIYAPPVLPPTAAPPPAPTLRAEAIAAALGRALAQIDDLVLYAERRRAARAEPTTLNDTTLEFLQDLAEAALRNRAEFALAKIEFRLPLVLEACQLQALEYAPATAPHFDIDGEPARAATRRPALLADGRCVKRGLAGTPQGRAA